MQRWSIRRVVLIIATLVVLLLAVLTGVGLFFPTRGTVTAPTCGTGQAMQLMAQAVPSATRAPVRRGPAVGWGVGTAETVQGRANFAVGVGGGSSEPVTVTLTESCPAPVEGTEQIPIDGGCVTYRSTITDAGRAVVRAGRRALLHVSRRPRRRGRRRGRPGAVRRARPSVPVGLRAS